MFYGRLRMHSPPLSSHVSSDRPQVLGRRKKLKKIFIYLAAAAIGLMLSSCSNSFNDQEKTDGKEESSQVIKAESDEIGRLFLYPAPQYNNELALFAANISNDVYDEETIDQKIKDKLKLLRFENTQTYRFYEKKERPKYLYLLSFFDDDGSAYVISKKNIVVNGEKTMLLLLLARGTQTNSEKMGDYFKGNIFTGREVTIGGKYRVWQHIQDFGLKMDGGLAEYLSDPSNEDVKNADNIKVLITGHSLGGAVANLVGAGLTMGGYSKEEWPVELDRENVYVYTFGSIDVTTDRDKNIEEGFENIHNIYNRYDSFGSHGNYSFLKASSEYAKFGHTDFYDLKYEEGLMTYNNHSMDNYIEGVTAGIMCLGENENNTLHETDFDIKGKWKSVGDEGFQQAQPGAVVEFDGEHCNFYSPKDTYTFFKENGEYKLICKNVLWQDSLSFNVNVIDDNNITITGVTSQVTKLKRIK